MRRASAIVAALLCAMPVAAAAQPADPPARTVPTLFDADEVRDDRERGLTVATGNVRVTHDGRSLLADRVIYDRGTETITASGNVSLHEPGGETVFADEVVLDTLFDTAVVDNIRVRLAGDNRIAAAGGRHVSGQITEFRKAVYSSCRICDDDEEPIWQIKARRTFRDHKNRDIVYEHAVLEFFGVPVFYLPRLSHPDPGEERRSGFLLPSYGSDDDLGVILKAPYYLDLAPNMDLTLAPVLTTQEGEGAEFQFRHLLDNAEYDISGSFYHDSERDSDDVDDIRGFVQSRSRVHIDRTWRAGADIHLTSDDPYLRKYEFVTRDTLENRLGLEGFFGRNYAAANAIYFQGLRAEDRAGEIPLVIPMLDYSFVSERGPGDQLWTVDANVLTLHRTEGADTRRLSAKVGWELPHTTGGGATYRLFGSLQSDGYWINGPLGAWTHGRLFPQAGLDWRLPLSRLSDGFLAVLEPAASLIVAPDAPETSGIPNEDSIGVEFDDSSLFSPNRYVGLDRVEGNPRINYGLGGSLYGAGAGYSSFFVGQSYRVAGKSDFDSSSGLRRRLSHIVGRVQISPADYLDALLRFRVDSRNWSTGRGELQVSAGVPELRLDGGYLLIRNREQEVANPADRLDVREEVNSRLSSAFSRHWSAGIDLHRDLVGEGRSLRHGAFLVYDDECFQFRVDYTRRFTSNRLVRPQDTIFLRIGLKTLAGFGS